jgi:hypothetical protein
MAVPHGHRKTSTLVAGVRLDGMLAPMVLDGPINGDWFEAYVRNDQTDRSKGSPIGITICVIADPCSAHI